MKELVKDKIPEFTTYASYCQLGSNEQEDALKSKIVEKANRVEATPNDQNLLEELADVHTVLEVFLDFKNISKENLLEQVEAKKAEKGDFIKLLLMNTDK